MVPLYKVHTRTHPGSVREINEDAISTVLEWRGPLELTDENLRSRGHLFVVADGMGGHAAGEVASRLAVERVFRSYYLSPHEPGEAGLRQAIASANQLLCEEAASQPAQHGMGTTLVAVLLIGEIQPAILVVNVGDSRAYRYREGSATQITRDHSWVAEQITAGVLSPEEAARHPYRNVITRSLGPDRDPTPDFFHLAIQRGDLLLLCSDGLSNLISAAELGELLGAYPADEAADLLLERSIERGAPDNVSFVLIEYIGESRGRALPRRGRWPWLLLALALLIGAGLLWGNRLAGLLPGPAGMASLATATSANTPTAAPPGTPSPAVSIIVLPTATPTGENSLPVSAPVAQPLRVGRIELAPPIPGAPTPDLAARFGGAAAGTGSTGTPQRERYVFYLEGPLHAKQSRSDGWQMAVAHQDTQGDLRLYDFILRGAWLPGARQPEIGDRIALIGQPIGENPQGNTIAIELQLLLNTTAQSGQGLPLWIQDAASNAWLPPVRLATTAATSSQAEPEAWWIFTVYGAGGGESLGILSPPGASGLPIAAWGHWLPPSAAGDPLRFELLEQPVYEWNAQEQVYRQPDN